MNRLERLRRAGWAFWVPCIFSMLALIATVASALEPQWIEKVFGESPDEGSGESEWWITDVSDGRDRVSASHAMAMARHRSVFERPSGQRLLGGFALTGAKRAP